MPQQCCLNIARALRQPILPHASSPTARRKSPQNIDSLCVAAPHLCVAAPHLEITAGHFPLSMFDKSEGTAVTLLAHGFLSGADAKYMYEAPPAPGCSRGLLPRTASADCSRGLLGARGQGASAERAHLNPKPWLATLGPYLILAATFFGKDSGRWLLCTTLLNILETFCDPLPALQTIFFRK